MFTYGNDTSVSYLTKQEHLKLLEVVISVLYENKVRLKLSSCLLGVRDLDFFGRKMISEGVAPSTEHVEEFSLIPELESV